MKFTADVQHIDKGMEAFKKNLELLRLRHSYVKAGVMGDKSRKELESPTNAEVAAFAEYGTSRSPARPWIRPPFIANKKAYLEILRSSYSKAMRTNAPKEFTRVLGLVGAKMAADIKRYVTSGQVQPPSSESTNKRKGSTKTLIDTAQMVNGVTWEVHE